MARFWWSAEQPLARDYSVGVFLLDREGRVILEDHGPPAPITPPDAPAETSHWQTGQWYIEEREFTLPYPMERQILEMKLAVYYWEQPARRYPAPGTDALGLLPVMRLSVFAW